MAFDDLNRGDQFLILLKRDRENLLRDFKTDQLYIEHNLRTYDWTSEEEAEQRRDLVAITKEIKEITTLLGKSSQELCVLGM